MNLLGQRQQNNVDSIEYLQNRRGAASFKHSIQLDKPYGWLDTAVHWCKTELTSEWRWHIVRMSSDQYPGIYIFYFDSDRDYCAFCMKFQ
jgi:hypothetical protein